MITDSNRFADEDESGPDMRPPKKKQRAPSRQRRTRIVISNVKHDSVAAALSYASDGSSARSIADSDAMNWQCIDNMGEMTVH